MPGLARPSPPFGLLWPVRVITGHRRPAARGRPRARHPVP